MKLLFFLFSLLSIHAYSQTMKSPYLFKVFNKLENSDKKEKLIDKCSNDFNYCSKIILEKFHPDYKEKYEGLGYITVNKSLDLDQRIFPVGIKKYVLDFGVSNNILRLIDNNSNLSYYFFEGTSHDQLLSAFVTASCFAVRDKIEEEVLYWCTHYVDVP